MRKSSSSSWDEDEIVSSTEDLEYDVDAYDEEIIEDDEEFDTELLGEYFMLYGSDIQGNVLFNLEKLRELARKRAELKVASSSTPPTADTTYSMSQKEASSSPTMTVESTEALGEVETTARQALVTLKALGKFTAIKERAIKKLKAAAKGALQKEKEVKRKRHEERSRKMKKPSSSKFKKEKNAKKQSTKNKDTAGEVGAEKSNKIQNFFQNKGFRRKQQLN
jgi:hypothetical protein